MYTFTELKHTSEETSEASGLVQLAHGADQGPPRVPDGEQRLTLLGGVHDGVGARAGVDEEVHLEPVERGRGCAGYAPRHGTGNEVAWIGEVTNQHDFLAFPT